MAQRWIPRLREPAVFGTLCGLLSAVAYTAANTLLRAVADCDPFWVSCIKAVPTVVIFAPVLMVQAWRGEPVLPPARAVWALVGAALLGQLGGNVLFQWSLGVVGMALAVPLTLGSMILTGALLGRFFLSEAIRPRAALAIAVLIAAIFILSQGAGEAYRSVTAMTGMGRGHSPLWFIVAGVSAACISGLGYSVLGVVIRRSVTGRVSTPQALVIVCTVGAVSLGLASFWRLGPGGLLATEPRDLLTMVGAGIFNAVAFVSLIKALQYATVLYVNALNATQATMAAIAGIAFFQEAVSGALLVGVALTIAGLLLMRTKPLRKSRRPLRDVSKSVELSAGQPRVSTVPCEELPRSKRPSVVISLAPDPSTVAEPSS